MKSLFLIPLIVFTPIPSISQEVIRVNINRACAAMVNIPYASDDFTDKEWEEFKNCVDFMRQFTE